MTKTKTESVLVTKTITESQHF